jgi:hypothetical protein
MLREYSFRNLSFDSDALDAVVGALNMLEEESPPLRSLYGVPCSNGDVPSAKSYFALHWYHAAPCRRRLGFPSWSSLGWQGPIYFLVNVKFKRTALALSCDISMLSEQGPQSQSLESLLNSTTASFRTITPHLLPVMEITVFTLELQVKSIAWDHDDPETSPGEDGLHLVFPLTDAYGCCVLPAWDDEAFEPTRHTTLLCAHVVDKPRITHGEEPDHATFSCSTTREVISRAWASSSSIATSSLNEHRLEGIQKVGSGIRGQDFLAIRGDRWVGCGMRRGGRSNLADSGPFAVSRHGAQSVRLHPRRCFA